MIDNICVLSESPFGKGSGKRPSGVALADESPPRVRVPGLGAPREQVELRGGGAATRELYADKRALTIGAPGRGSEFREVWTPLGVSPTDSDTGGERDGHAGAGDRGERQHGHAGPQEARGRPSRSRGDDPGPGPAAEVRRAGRADGAGRPRVSRRPRRRRHGRGHLRGRLGRPHGQGTRPSWWTTSARSARWWRRRWRVRAAT